ncbi:hypothetical protein [Selenomonas ruminantium]|jgi:hypothetical protein|uniref:hypothetical protein n=1 Tax=Selenomonas ruminantium TaxID=971 RepID=UPI0026F0A3E5|nr:hypothetical protein [Selenomonas ruminantium]
MKTSKIKVNSRGYGMEYALDEVEDFSRLMGFDERSARRARLLAEETMSMVRAIVDEFSASFWMESTPECNCELHLQAEAPMDYDKKQELISASTQQRNEASVGIMGKIKDFIEDSLYNMQDGASVAIGESQAMGMAGMVMNDIHMWSWSLEQYRQDVQEQKEKGDDEAIDDLLDELEKSIVANIADDIKVSVKGNSIEMIIRKNFLLNRDGQ